jgi:ATP-dependent DNA helicase PIF1
MENLNEKQQNIHQEILRGKNAFITGFAGSGKSYLTMFIYTTLLKSGKNVALSAMTGCASVLINASTLHSTLGIGLARDPPEVLVKKMRKREGVFNYLSNLEVLIIDEVSMLSDELFDKIAEYFRIIHKSDKPFGRLQLVLVGDMSQLKPVEGDYCFYAQCWDQLDINVCVLTENMRVDNDIPFHNLLMSLRWGKISDLEIIESMRSNDFENMDIKPTRLFATNKRVNEINECEIYKLVSGGNRIDNYSIIYSKNPCHLKASKKYIQENKIPEFIGICIGSQVMVTRNIEDNIVNGTRGVVVATAQKFVTIKLMNGNDYNLFYFQVTDEDNKDINFQYLPLTLAWAMTIHKCQGATIDCIEIDLGDSIFAPGQAYVAMSRARASKNVKITNFSKKSIRADKRVIEFYKKYT